MIRNPAPNRGDDRLLFGIIFGSPYTGANFLLNGVAGMLLVSMMLLQLGGGLSAHGGGGHRVNHAHDTQA
jgi:hypothetical protein